MINIFDLIEPKETIQTAEVVMDPNLSPITMTLSELDDLFAKACKGGLTPDVVRQSFERLARDLVPVKAELAKLTIKQLERITPNYHKERKEKVVQSALLSVITRYGFLTIIDGCLTVKGYTTEERVAYIRTLLAKLDQPQLDQYQAKAEAEFAARKERFEKHLKSLKNPETLEEFDQFIKHEGEHKLTPEQRALRDELVASKLKAEQQEKEAAAAKVEGVRVGSAMQIVETKHTRDHYDLFVVKLEERVERDAYLQLAAAAKRLGGWYSSYTSGGAIPGFQFKLRSAAEQFIAIGEGQTVDTSEVKTERKQDRKAATAERLLGMADKLEEAASAKLNHDRKTNTARRARMASSAESQARSDIALAKTMRNLANSIGEGSAVHLEGLTTKAQIEMLAQFVRSARDREIASKNLPYVEAQKYRFTEPTEHTCAFVKFPAYTVEIDNLHSTIRKLKDLPGLVRIAARLERGAAQIRKDSSASISAEIVDVLFEKLGDKVSDILPWQWVSANENLHRLARMGVTTPEQLRMACREFVAYKVEKASANVAVELERKLIGSKVGIDFFPTPSHLARRMVQMAGIREGVRCCEPEAGNGNIAVEMRAAGAEPDVVELSSSLREILAAKNFNVIGWDFLDVTKTFQAFVMNPPFGNNSDVIHIRHAYSLLEENGVIVAIVGEGAFIRAGKVETEFREWLQNIGAEVEQLPQGTFDDKTLMATTGANARLIKIVK